MFHTGRLMSTAFYLVHEAFYRPTRRDFQPQRNFDETHQHAVQSTGKRFYPD